MGRKLKKAMSQNARIPHLCSSRQQRTTAARQPRKLKIGAQKEVVRRMSGSGMRLVMKGLISLSAGRE